MGEDWELAREPSLVSLSHEVARGPDGARKVAQVIGVDRVTMCCCSLF